MKTFVLVALATAVMTAASVSACSEGGASLDAPADGGADAGPGTDGSISTANEGGKPPEPMDADVDAQAAGGSGLTTGTDYTLAYSADEMGFDVQLSVDATFDAQGRMTAYDADDENRLAIGAAHHRSSGGDALSAWGTWQGGPTTGVFSDKDDLTFAAPGGGMHYAIARRTPDTALPTTGAATYTLVSGTKPTRSDASTTGTLTSASVTCKFEVGTCDFTISWEMEDGPASVTNIPGTMPLPRRTFSSSAGKGVFFGPSAERLALVYGVDMGGGQKVVRGAATLKR